MQVEYPDSNIQENDPLLFPARFLEGQELADGWRVGSLIDRPADATGGHFSYSYRAEKGLQLGFLKALNLSRALGSTDPAGTLQSLTDAYVFERQLVEDCVRMNRIVTGVAFGTVRAPEGSIISVPYIIFEWADGGDVRSFMKASSMLDEAWLLRSLHHMAVGLQQLHSAKIAHQDLKPSNVLVMNGETMIGDLGNASRGDGTGPWDRVPIAGALAHAPPEQLYKDFGHTMDERIACDLYHLGSMVFFYFTDSSLTALVRRFLHPDYMWDRYGGTYAQAEPFVRQAHEAAFELLRRTLPDVIADRVEVLVRQLTDPNPARRGHPRARATRHQSDYDLARYVSAFDLLASRAEYGLVGLL